MVDVQPKSNEIKTSEKNGEWEIFITDPEQQQFSFTQAMSHKYIMTDVKSPLGQKVTLYNTLPEGNNELIIGLNMAYIDQTRISSIRIKSEDNFFENWDVALVNNRDRSSKLVANEEEIAVYPVIELNKLMKMGFTDQSRDEKPLFELHLVRKA